MTRQHFIKASAPNEVDLSIWEEVPNSDTPQKSSVLFLHGYGLPTGKAFDVKGSSWMGHMASIGVRSWALDFAGFGSSRSTDNIEHDFTSHVAPSRAADAAIDISRAIAFIRLQQPEMPIDLVAWSWGGVVAGTYLSNDKSGAVRSLCLLGSMHSFDLPSMAKRFASPEDAQAFDEAIPAIQSVPPDAIISQWKGMLDDLKLPKSELVCDQVLRSAVETFLGSDPSSSENELVRRPTGPLRDLFEIWTSRPVYDASKINVPVLVIRGAGDPFADSDLVSRLPVAQEVVIENATHYAFLEDARHEIYDRLETFRSSQTNVEERSHD